MAQTVDQFLGITLRGAWAWLPTNMLCIQHPNICTSTMQSSIPVKQKLDVFQTILCDAVSAAVRLRNCFLPEYTSFWVCNPDNMDYEIRQGHYVCAFTQLFWQHYGTA
jgi:hypothetical protein